MPNQAHVVTKDRLSLRIKAVRANREAFPHLEEPVAPAEELVGLQDNITLDQASLTAGRQEVTKKIGELVSEARKLLVLLDAAVRLRYGNRSEKLVEFGQQPFRSKPRVQKVGPDGEPLKRSKKAKPPAVLASNE
jgi:hypothetical protein